MLSEDMPSRQLEAEEVAMAEEEEEEEAMENPRTSEILLRRKGKSKNLTLNRVFVGGYSCHKGSLPLDRKNACNRNCTSITHSQSGREIGTKINKK